MRIRSTSQPIDTVRVRIQCGAASSSAAVAVSLWRAEGALGFVRGALPPLLATDGPHNALGFAVQGEAARWLSADGGLPELPTACLAGSVAGLAQCAVVVPSDRIKVQQVGGRESTLQCARRLDAAQGVARGLFIGGRPRQHGAIFCQIGKCD